MADILSDISQDPDITLHLLGNYIGSAYSPQVEVTETDTGHEVAITYDDATDGITTKTFSVEDGDDYVLTTDDRNAIAGIVEDDLDPYVEAMQQATAAANTAEQARATAETGRATAEATRASEWATIKAGAQAATAGAENVDATMTKSGSVATVTVTDRNGTAHTATLTDGVSPTASVERVEGGALVTVTDASGTTTDMLYDAELTDGSVTEAKLSDGAVTGAKLAQGAVTGPKIVPKAVTADKLDVSTTYTVTDGDLTISLA